MHLNYIFLSFLYSLVVILFYSYLISFFKNSSLLKILTIIGIIFDFNILILFVLIIFRKQIYANQYFFIFIIVSAFLASIIFQIINKWRLFKYLIKEEYLKTSYVINVGVFGVFQLIILFCYILKINLFSFGSIVFSVIIFGAILRNYIKLYNRQFVLNKYANDDSLPSISVAIPARNETDDLIKLLESIIESDYPKMEVLVLDDCSSSPKTAEIIRQFSHDGVIFVQGEIPSKDFLAKNYAYQQLYEASNGDYIIFMGVDCRVDKYFIRRTIEYMQVKNKQMLSVLPINDLGKSSSIKSIIPQSLRYFWELAFFRKFIKRPPVLSTCWAVSRNLLSKYDGFKGLKKDILPERTIANYALRSKDSYAFLLSNEQLNLTSFKKYNEQIDTAIRVKYPTLKRNLSSVLIVVGIEFWIFLLPILEIINGLIFKKISEILIFSAIFIINWASYYFVLKITTRKKIFLFSIIYVWAILFDIYLWILSSLKYEFGSVVWKDRNICIPIRRFKI